MKLLPRTEYRLSFTLEGQGSAGFCFPCDAHARVDLAALSPQARANYLACIEGAVGGEKVGRAQFSAVPVWRNPSAEP